MKRTRPCEICGIEMELSRERFLYVVPRNLPVFCEQCRRYVTPGTARMSQPIAESGDVATRLRRKTGRGAKTKRGLASWPLKRCTPPSCEAGGALDE
jgi:hypothetical protein